jgi:D-alanyl-D-alanine carboxypeptidase/D-alanyl-D-alanine-endopeptidase (penicillin-binding protein 4)
MTHSFLVPGAVRALALALLAVLLGGLPLARAADLPSAVSEALQQAGIPANAVGMVVQAVDGGPPLLSHNAQQAMNPASAMKLVTTYAALDMLGPAYTWRSELLADASPRDGRLNGNLYLRGSGDPKLALEQFWLLLRQLRQRGVKEINGDLILDRSAFALSAHDPGEFDQQPLRPYNAGPDALLVNFKSLRLLLQADAAGNAVP